MKSYVDFELAEKKPKTAVYHVLSKSGGDILATIRWHGPWRKYVFDPADETLWSCGCLAEVQTFIEDLMNARKVAK